MTYMPVGDASLFLDGSAVTIQWGTVSRSVAFTAFKDPDHKNPIGNSVIIERSGEAVSQNVNVGELVSDQPPGLYYIVSVAEGYEGNLATFDWNKSGSVTDTPPTLVEEPVSKQPQPPPTGLNSMGAAWDNAEWKRVQQQPPAPASVATPVPPEISAVTLLETLLDDLEQLDKELDIAINKVSAGRAPTRAFINSLTNRLERVERRYKGFLAQNPDATKDFASVVSKGQEVLDKIEKLKEVQPLDPNDSNVRAGSAVTPSKQEAGPKTNDPRGWRYELNKLASPPAPPPDLTGRVVGIEADVEGIKKELGKKATTEDLAKVRDELGNQVKGLGDEFRAGNSRTSGELVALTDAVKGLKPATPPPTVSGGTPSQGGAAKSDNGGKVSTDAPGPYHAGHGLRGLLIGLGAMLALVLIIWLVHLLSKNSSPTAGIAAAPMMMPVVIITNLPPTAAMSGGQQAIVAPPTQPTYTSEEIKARQAAIRASQANNPELGAPTPVTTPGKATGSVVTITAGNGSIIAGRDVEINHHHHYPPPTSSGTEGQVIVTPPPTASITSSDASTATSARTSNGHHLTKTKCGDRQVHTPVYWSPTLVVGSICVPVAADGSGSEGYWVYKNPPHPGLPQQYGYNTLTMPTK